LQIVDDASNHILGASLPNNNNSAECSPFGPALGEESGQMTCSATTKLNAP
jgi:hypothetical protein